jgi:hypothetical protein
MEMNDKRYIRLKYDEDTTEYVGFKGDNGYSYLYKIEYKAGDPGYRGETFFFDYGDRWIPIVSPEKEWSIKTDNTHYDVLDEETSYEKSSMN